MTQVWQRCNILISSSNALNGITFENQTHQQQYCWILGHPQVI